MSKYVQCKFENGNSVMTSWVENKVEVGNYVTFKDKEGTWEVVSKGSESDLLSSLEFHEGMAQQ